MSRLDPMQRLQPSLIDRLIDPDSGGTAAGQGYSLRDMLESVQRDLEALLNTRQSHQGLPEEFAEVHRSLVAYGLRDVPYSRGPLELPSATSIWLVGGVLAVVLVVLSRMVGAPGGYVAGSVVQVPVLAFGLVVPMMFVVGGLFVVLWVVSIRLGGRIDRERAAYDAEHPETAPNAD